MELERTVSKTEMIISAGLLVLKNNQVLLVSQRTNDNGKTSFSIPKGIINDDETPLMAAIRETYEETGFIVPHKYIIDDPKILNIKTSKIMRRIIYYMVELPEDTKVDLKILDSQEIDWVGFVPFEKVEQIIQPFQEPIVAHLNSLKIPLHILSKMENEGYITCSYHPQTNLKIYNYTQKCKKYEYWNEVTLWCRGLILDESGNILYRPFKKFFELHQLYPYFKPKSGQYKIYEKIDGFLGILYWINGFPFLATRDSFVSYPAVRGTSILYKKYWRLIQHLNPAYTYLFEIVFPNNLLIIDYGEMEDIILIGIYDNVNNREISIDSIEIPLPKATEINIGNYEISDLMSVDYPNKEGFVLVFKNGQRLKIKFPNYKNKYAIKFNK